ncbi:MAG: hypothetical protein M3448_01445 [Pseudomonadota bacterium]|nr:hypothetical protein [Sphingomonas sp.]MDQ3482066.1 hypothetical protein [Pseudomonadota bacterium]
MSTQGRTTAVRIGGALIMLLAAAAALLPLAQHIPGRTVVGLMLVGAGSIELAAVLIGHGHRTWAGIAAGASLLAGLRLAVDPGANFFTVLNLVILWLVVRSAALFFSARLTAPAERAWVYFAAAVDLLLAVLLLGGLPVAVLIYGLFGQTSEIVATFAWIFALSFVAAGLLLFTTARSRGATR